MVTIDCLRHEFVNELLRIIPSDWGYVVFHRHFTNAPYTWGSFPALFTSTPPYLRFSKRSIRNRIPITKLLKYYNFYTIGYNDGNGWLTGHYGYANGFDEFYDTSQQRPLRSDTKGHSSIDEIHSIFRKLIKNLRCLAESVTKGANEVSFLHLMKWYIIIRYIVNIFANRWDYLWIDSRKLVAGLKKRLYRILPKDTFIWIHFMDLHAPYATSVRNTREFVHFLKTIYDLLKYITVFGEDYSKDLVSNLREYYVMSFNYLQGSLSLLFETLRHVSESKGYDVIVMLTGDHGEEFEEHGAIGHEGLQLKYYSIPHLYNELVHVPMIIAGSRIPFKHEVFELTSHLDVAPTIIDLTKPSVPKNLIASKHIGKLFFGKSLVPYLKNYQDKCSNFNSFCKDYVVIESEAIISKIERKKVICCSYAVLSHRYKYIWNPLTGEELYDLLKDPREKCNIASENKDLLLLFRKYLIRYINNKTRFEIRYKLIKKFINTQTKY